MIPKRKSVLILFSLPLFTAVLLVAQIFPTTVLASSKFEYTAKLLTTDISVLEKVGTRIEEVYGFSNHEQFQNVYSFSSNLSLEQLKQKIGSSVEYVDMDIIIESGASEKNKLPNDPGFTTNKANIDKQWGLAKAGFVAGWKLSKGDPNIVVAVIDTGIDSTHEDLIDSNFVNGYNFVKDKKISAYSNSDDNGHGTLVAGVIGATTNNKTGISGATWDTSLMAVKALNERGSGRASQISEAIVWATDNGADIINMSLGGIGFAHNKPLADAITYAFDRNVVIISAAGNDVAITGGNLDIEPVFPICNDNGQNMIIGVGATDSKDLKPDFANFGKACVDVVAPGRRILSTINHDPATGLSAPDSYAYASGTSLAVPFVSAQAALLKSLYPLASNRQIRDRIIATADSIDKLNLSQCGGKSCKGLLGSGRINVSSSLKEEILTISDGDVVQVNGSGDWYYINGGKRQLITAFVKNQRFKSVTPKQVLAIELQRFSEGSFAEPQDGTLVQGSTDSTVYYISKGARLPITYQVFQLHKFQFKDVILLSSAEVDSWILGSFMTPPEGSVIRGSGNPTIYWVINSTLHPVNHSFYVERGLNKFPLIRIPDRDLSKFPVGEPYTL